MCCVCVFARSLQTRAQNGCTALLSATGSNGDVDCVQLLIDAGADTNAKNNVRVGPCEYFGVFLIS